MENKIQNLEDELKVLKNEVQAVLLDIKDSLISGGGFGGGFSGGAALPIAEQTATPFNLTDDGGAPSPQQVYITQLPAAPPPVVAAPPEPAPQEKPESVETGWGEDVSDQGALIFEEEPESVGIDWGGGAADQAAPGPGESPGLGEAAWGSGAADQAAPGPAGGPGFGEAAWSGGAIHQAAPGPAQQPGFMEAGQREGAGDQPSPDFHPDSASDIESSDAVDLPLLAILTPWLSRAIATVGKEHLEKLVEIYDVARNPSPRLKQAILLLVDLHDECSAGKLSGDALVREAIPLLIELDSLLLRHRTGTLESAVLSLLYDRKAHNRKARGRKASDG